MREKQNNWQRIEAVIKWANMSTNYFARYIGLARGENLYQIKRGNNGISLNVADRIVSKFPQIDKLWLLTGEGQMFADARQRGMQIPFYNTDVEQHIASLDRLEAECDLVVLPVGTAIWRWSTTAAPWVPWCLPERSSCSRPSMRMQ